MAFIEQIAHLHWFIRWLMYCLIFFGPIAMIWSSQTAVRVAGYIFIVGFSIGLILLFGWFIILMMVFFAILASIG